MRGPITLDVKQTAKRSAGKPHAAFDVAGTGNVAMVVGMRSKAKVTELPPTPTVRAPALDPTARPGAYRLLTAREANRKCARIVVQRYPRAECSDVDWFATFTEAR